MSRGWFDPEPPASYAFTGGLLGIAVGLMVGLAANPPFLAILGMGLAGWPVGLWIGIRQQKHARRKAGWSHLERVKK